MTDTAQTATQAAASTALITTADRSVKTLLGTISNLSKLTAELGLLGATIEAQSADIQQNESRLAHLDAEFDLKKRTAAANLNVAVLENEHGVMQVLMAKNKLATVTIDELTKLQDELTQAKADNTAAIDAAVNANAKELHASYNADILSIGNAHSVETATLKAEATSKDERIAFLSTEINSLRQQINDERNTRLEIAKADASRQGVVVNAGNGR